MKHKEPNTKEWLLKVHRQAQVDLEYRKQLAQDVSQLVEALDWIVEGLTQGDPRYDAIPCVRNARVILEKLKG
jgi:hypothetical protein